MHKEGNSDIKNKALKAWLEKKNKKSSRSTIQPQKETTPTVLSYGQRRLWLLQQLFPENPFYQYSHLYRFRGKLDLPALEKSLQQVVARHSILRTTFSETEAGVRQIADPEVKAKIVEHDLTKVPADQQEQRAMDIVRATSYQSFDLKQGPLFRFTLLVFSKTHHWLVLDMHHIIGDRWSLELINKEMAESYFALQKGQEVQRNPLSFQYADYARRQQSQGVAEKDLDYWLNKLNGELPTLTLPTDYPRPSTPDFKGKMLHKKLSAGLSRQLKTLSKEKQTTPFVVLLAAFKTLLYRYTAQTDILVGSPFSNRDRSSLEQLVGFFNETLVLRSALSPEIRFSDLISAVKTTTLEALTHQNMPFDQLVQKLRPERQGSANPLFQVMFLYNALGPSLDFGNELEVKDEVLDLEHAKFDLTLHVNEKEEGLSLSFEYAKDLFKASTVERMLGHLETLLKGMVAQPDQTLKALPLLSPAERQQILGKWNAPRSSPPDITGIHQLMEEQAALFPDRKAVIDERNDLTYSQLDQWANTVAQRLLEIGVDARVPIGLYCRRSIDMLIGIFGILKAGGAYLPLDPDYPSERIAFMLSDSGAQLVLTQEDLLPQLPDSASFQVLSLEPILEAAYSQEAPRLPQVRTDQSAYMIYTSGSTGLPKGVPVTHRNLIHSTSARFHFYPENPSCFLLLSSFSFDSSVAGIFWTLCSGGTLLLPKKRIEQDIDQLSGLIKKHVVSHTLLLPSLYTLLLAHADKTDLRSLRAVIVAGEACSPDLVRRHFRQLPDSALYNEYGPTEATVWCIAHQIQASDTPIVPIGRPIPNMQAYILDQERQPIPVGIAGELYIAGAGLTSGYLNRPELNRERFVANPFTDEPEAKMYKTGDLVKYREDGVIEFLGRADHQVKIRGHRVEPEEISALLSNHPQVTDAVVLAVKVSDQTAPSFRLVAYVSGFSQDETTLLNAYLRDQLPAYLVPSAIIALPQFPRLPNGKIDRNVLPDANEVDLQLSTTYEAPIGPVEIQLADIWQEVLNLKRVGRNDNFFDIGGDSLLSIQIVTRTRNTGIELAANQLFQHQTIAALAKSLENDQSGFSALVPLKTTGTQPPLFCIHSGGAHVFFYAALAEYLAAERPVYALQPAGLDDSGHYHRSIEEMAAHYIEAVKPVQAQGPYYLLGTCFSNAVALEMGKQLKKSGEEVAGLFIIDSGPVHLLGDADWGKNATFKKFLDLLKRGDFQRIKRKILNRFKPTEATSDTWKAIEAEDDLREMVEALNRAYAQYSWSPFSGKIQFIRSSEFHQRPDKQYHLDQWKKLAKGGLEVHVVPGHHLTLFKEPEVQGLARKIRECLEPVNA